MSQQEQRARNYPSGPQAAMNGTPRRVGVGELRRNPWNYNVQSEVEFGKLCESMRRFGVVQAVVVRTVAGVPGYEIINGEHRWLAAAEVGRRELDVFDLGPISDAHAKQLCVVLNELSGTADEARLADIMRDLAAQSSTLELSQVMPYSEREIERIVAEVNFRFVHLPEHDSRGSAQERPSHGDAPAGAPPPPKRKFTELVISYPQDVGERVAERLKKVARKPEDALGKLLDAWEARRGQ